MTVCCHSSCFDTCVRKVWSRAVCGAFNELCFRDLYRCLPPFIILSLSAAHWQHLAPAWGSSQSSKDDFVLQGPTPSKLSVVLQPLQLFLVHIMLNAGLQSQFNPRRGLFSEQLWAWILSSHVFWQDSSSCLPAGQWLTFWWEVVSADFKVEFLSSESVVGQGLVLQRNIAAAAVHYPRRQESDLLLRMKVASSKQRMTLRWAELSITLRCPHTTIHGPI